MIRKALHIEVSDGQAGALKQLKGTAGKLAIVSEGRGYKPTALVNPTVQDTIDAMNAFFGDPALKTDEPAALFFTYGGHGVSHFSAAPTTEENHFDEFLSLADGELCDNFIINRLGELPSHVDVLMMFDCCLAKGIASPAVKGGGGFFGEISNFFRDTVHDIRRFFRKHRMTGCEPEASTASTVKASVVYYAAGNEMKQIHPWLSDAFLTEFALGSFATHEAFAAVLKAHGAALLPDPRQGEFGAYKNGEEMFTKRAPLA